MSQRLIKLAASLQHKKYRIRENLFVAEGTKLVLDLIEKGKVKYILCTEKWANTYPHLPTMIVNEQQLKKASSLQTVTPVIGIFEIPEVHTFDYEEFPVLILDTIQDPGNLGTIVRTAAWFGIKHIVCSPETVDIYNPKVVQATMGALALVTMHYEHLTSILEKLQEKNIPIYGTFLEGNNIYQTQLSRKSAIVIGNEGKGISKELHSFINTPIHIPAFSAEHPESLNASVSTAIVCSEVMRPTQS